MKFNPQKLVLTALFAALKQQINSASKGGVTLAQLLQNAGRTEQHGHVGIVAAHMGHTGHGALIGPRKCSIGFRLLYGQRVAVRP